MKRRGKRRLPGYSLGWALAKGENTVTGVGAKGPGLPPPMNPPPAPSGGTVTNPMVAGGMSVGGKKKREPGAPCVGQKVIRGVWIEVKTWVGALVSVTGKLAGVGAWGTGEGRWIRVTRDEGRAVVMALVLLWLQILGIGIHIIYRFGKDMAIW